jgi:hypothetical protein
VLTRCAFGQTGIGWFGAHQFAAKWSALRLKQYSPSSIGRSGMTLSVCKRRSAGIL